jgi:hypothetical protein
MVWLSTTALPAFADDCVDKLSPDSRYAEVIACLKDQLRTVSTFREQLQTISEELKKQSTLTPNLAQSRAFGQVYANTTGKTLIVIVTAYNNAHAYSMYGNVAASTNSLPTAKGNSTTTVASSFVDDKFSSSITFVVPGGDFYNVTTDGGTETLVFWTEVTL